MCCSWCATRVAMSTPSARAQGEPPAEPLYPRLAGGRALASPPSARSFTLVSTSYTTEDSLHSTPATRRQTSTSIDISCSTRRPASFVPCRRHPRMNKSAPRSRFACTDSPRKNAAKIAGRNRGSGSERRTPYSMTRHIVISLSEPSNGVSCWQLSLSPTITTCCGKVS